MKRLFLFALLLAPSIATSAQELEEDEIEVIGAEELGDDGAGAFENLAVREHVYGDSLKYRSVAGLLDLPDDAGVKRGDVFFTYYEALGDDGTPLHETQARPVTYVFNGGPGAASVWLHLGTAGPYRVPMGDDGTPPGPPYNVVENADSWLPATDLVFVDPVGTGYSRAVATEKDGKVTDEGERFYGVENDVRSVGDFVRRHCTRFGRWDDPKYLAGESYGTTRAALLASSLHDRFGLDVNGVILVSSVLDFATLREKDNNPLPYVAFSAHLRRDGRFSREN